MKIAFWISVAAAALAAPGIAAPAKKSPAAPPPAEAPAPAEPKPPLLGFCAEPVKPLCVDAPATYTAPKVRDACNKEMDRYVKYVFSYRMCLNIEMERAVRQTNETIQRHKCRMAGGKKCP